PHCNPFTPPTTAEPPVAASPEPAGGHIAQLTNSAPITQDRSGAVTLQARDATTHGVMMRYEPATNKNCLGYWVNPDDWAEWEFSVTKPGGFEVEVWQGCGKGQGGSDAEVEVGGREFPFVVQETGHFQIFVPRRVGRVNLA